MPAHLKSEREEMMLRIQLVMGDGPVPVRSGHGKGTGGDKAPALQALALHASYLSSSEDKSRRHAILDQLKALLGGVRTRGEQILDRLNNS